MSNDDRPESRAERGREAFEELLGPDAQAKLKDWTSEARRWVEAHPWAAVLGALAVGYAIGALHSRRERDSG